MINSSTICKQLQRVQAELKGGSSDTRDAVITELHEYLEECSAVLFPSFLYPLFDCVLAYYCREILPSLNLSAEDSRFVCESFERTIHRLKVQEKMAQDLEAQFRQMLLQMKSGTLETAGDVVRAICKIVTSVPLPWWEGLGEGEQEITKFPGTFDKALEKQYRTLKKSLFTSAQVLPFFEALISNVLSGFVPELPSSTIDYSPPGRGTIDYSPPGRGQGWVRHVASVQDLFWHQLRDLLQPKAVLVNTLNREALITRLDVSTALESSGLDELEFKNTVDDTMYSSCWNALQAARTFLEDQFPDTIKNRSLRVRCSFPNPAAEYNDTSASLLVGLKIVGNVLDMEIDPHVVVSGAVDAFGQILSVDHVAEKVAAADCDPAIHQIYLPADGLFMPSQRVTITPVKTFPGAVESYYGEPFRKKQRQFSRRQMIKGAVTFAAVPLGLFTFKNIFTHPVSGQDLWNLEYAKSLYQKQSKHQKAASILQFILKKFDYDTTSTEVRQLKAQALIHLGLIYMQQHSTQESLYQLRRAFDLWKSIHDKEQQVQTLLFMGSVYYYSVAIDGSRKHGEIGLRHIHQANNILNPSMNMFKQSKGDYYGTLGSLYHALGEYEIAKEYMEKSVEYFDEAGANWPYHLSTRCSSFYSCGIHSNFCSVFQTWSRF